MYADLQIVNRTLGESVRKAEADVRRLREAILMAAGALKIAGYHDSAERCMAVWKETAS
jgi:hypothetical protein